jgi:hypothetical protein
MSFSFAELVRRASLATGSEIQPHQARYAVKQGYLQDPERLPNGWNRYSDKHVAELVAYMQTRSRLALSGSPAPEATAAKLKGGAR